MAASTSPPEQGNFRSIRTGKGWWAVEEKLVWCAKQFAMGMLLSTAVAPSFASDAEWVDGLSVVALHEERNEVAAVVEVMSASKVLQRGFQLPAHDQLLDSRRKYERDEFGTRQYLEAYRSYYERERERIRAADSFLLPANVNLGTFNFELSAYAPDIQVRGSRGDGTFVCGPFDTRQGTELLSCIRVVNLVGYRNTFSLLEMSEDVAVDLRRKKVSYTIRVVPIQEGFDRLDLEVNKVGHVERMMRVRATELLAYDRETRQVLFHQKAPVEEGLDDSGDIERIERMEDLESVPNEVQLELPS